jgi:MFS family permease
VLTLLYAACLVVSAMVAGAWSDRLGVRKPFVMVSGVVMSCAAALLAIVQTWSAALVGAVILGIGYGVYLAVDFALITQVLPRADDRARDLGVINIANALPQVLAPAIAGPIITWFAAHGTHADGYRALYLLAAAIGIAAALLIRKIRTVD